MLPSHVPTNNILVTYGALQVLYCIVLYCISKAVYHGEFHESTQLHSIPRSAGYSWWKRNTHAGIGGLLIDSASRTASSTGGARQAEQSCTHTSTTLTNGKYSNKWRIFCWCSCLWTKVEDCNWETIFYQHYRSVFNHRDVIGSAKQSNSVKKMQNRWALAHAIQTRMKTSYFNLIVTIGLTGEQEASSCH